MVRHRYLLAAAGMVTGAVMVLTSGPAQAAPSGATPAVDPVVQLKALERSFAGHSGFAGGYIDDAGRPAVNVTSAALAARVRQAGGIARQVAVPLAALRRAADRIEAQAGDSVQIAIPDISENRLYVSASTAGLDAQAIAAVVAVRRAGIPVTVETPDVRPLAAHFGGWGMSYPWSPRVTYVCTSGFNARNSNGRSVIITAGHCGPVDSKWYSHHGGYLLGTMKRKRYGGAGIGENDWAVLRSSGIYRTPAAVRDAGATKDVRRLGSPREGMRVCRNGTTTHTRCGRIIRFRAGRVIVTNVYADNGDSGGPLYRRIPNTDNVAALGILSKGGYVNGEFRTYYQPLGEVLNKANLRLKTRT